MRGDFRTLKTHRKRRIAQLEQRVRVVQRKPLPRIDLSGLTREQRLVFTDAADMVLRKRRAVGHIMDDLREFTKAERDYIRAAYRPYLRSCSLETAS
jgi:hypothetical protein